MTARTERRRVILGVVRVALVFGVAAALLSGCGLFGGGASPTPTPLVPIESPLPSPTVGAGDPPSATAEFVETPTPGPDGSPSLEPFSCALPVTDAGTVARAQIVDVRVGTHEDYDRVVFEFASGIPEYELDEASPPFVRDPSGMPFTVLGSDHLQLTMRGGTKQSEAGTATYTGPTSFHPHFTQLQQLEEAGDFEAQSTWIVGRDGPGCVRVLTLEEPSRLVIDLEHP